MAKEATRSTGTVKWFNGPKGYGFITPDEGADDLFVHQTSIQSDGFRTLYEAQRVEFEVEVGEDGRTRAVDVVLLRGPNRSPGGGGGGRGGRGGEWYGGRGGGGGAVECYNCGRLGHVARDCYQGTGGRRGGGRGGRNSYGGDGEDYNRGGRGGRVDWGYGRGGRGGGGGRRGGYYGGRGGGGGGVCYNCGEEGHFARECPTGQN